MRAGIAIADITPRTAVPLMGHPGVRRISTGVRDPLQATVLHLRGGRGGIILASLDLFWLEPLFAQSLRKQVAAATALSEDNVFITCTHTHSGPVTDRLIGCLGDPAYAEPDMAYLGQVRDQVVAAASKAAATTKNAEFACAETPLAFGALPLPETTARVLGVRIAGGGSVLATIVMAPLYPRWTEPGCTEISADFPTRLRAHLMDGVTTESVVLFLPAPGFDSLLIPPVGCPSDTGLDQVAAALARAATAALAQTDLAWTGGDPVLGGKRTVVQAPKRVFPTLWDAKTRWGDLRMQYTGLLAANAEPNETERARQHMLESSSTLKYALTEQNGKLDGLLAPYRTLELQVLRIHDARLVGLPGMCSAGYADTILQQAPPHTCIVQPVNGNLQGYLVTPTEADAGATVRLASPFAPQAGGRLVQAALTMMAKDAP